MLEWILSSAVLTAIVIVLRLIFKGKMSLRLQYALWLIVLVRLLVPVSFGSAAWSVQNLVERAAEAPKVTYTEINDAQTGLPASVVAISGFTPEETDAQNIGINIQVEPGERQYVREGLRIEVTPAGETSLAVTDILMIVWGTGAGLVALWLLLTNLLFYRKLRRSRERLEIEDAPLPVYVTDRIDTPCLFGLIRPKIYVTPEVMQDSTVLRCSIEHEATHCRHGDYLWAILRGLCLAVHWFDPLVWVAAVLSRNDAELACDEATIKRLGEEHRADYGRTLLRLTCEKRPAIFVAATTMTGSGRSIKERIRLIVKQPKTAILTLIAIVLIIAVAVGCTFTGAKSDETEQPAQATGDPDKTDLPKAEQDIPADATVIGQAAYCGCLYDVPDVTTGVAFYEDQMYFDAVLIPSTETPRQSLECNVPGKTASFAVYQGDLILIVDGTQYDLANAEKIMATTTPIGRVDLTESPDEQLAQTAWQQAEAAAGEIGYDVAADRYTCNTWGTSKDVIFVDRDGTRSLAVSFEKTANGEWTNTLSGSVIAIDGGRLKDLVSVSDEIMNAEGSDRIAPVIDFARDYTAQCAAYWYERTGNPITAAEITRLTKINTGTAALWHEIVLYQLEYRLLPEGQEQIVLAEGMQTEEIDGKTWITEQAGGGQPYLLLVRSTSDDWLRICPADTAMIERIYAANRLQGVNDNANQFAAIWLYAAFDGKGAVCPSVAVESLYESGDEVTLTLYLGDGSPWSGYTLEDPEFNSRLREAVFSFNWTRLDAPSVEPGAYWLTAVSADGTKHMTFRADGGAGTLEYDDGRTTSVWRASPISEEYAEESVAARVRGIYNEIESNIDHVVMDELPFQLDGAPEQIAGYFVNTAYFAYQNSLAPGSRYRLDDLEIVRWSVDEVSSDGYTISGGFVFAFTPSASYVMAGNDREGTGKYAGKIISSQIFVLQLQPDGNWHCVRLETG